MTEIVLDTGVIIGYGWPRDTGDNALYDTRRELWKAGCKILDKKIPFSIKKYLEF